MVNHISPNSGAYFHESPPQQKVQEALDNIKSIVVPVPSTLTSQQKTQLVNDFTTIMTSTGNSPNATTIFGDCTAAISNINSPNGADTANLMYLNLLKYLPS